MKNKIPTLHQFEFTLSKVMKHLFLFDSFYRSISFHFQNMSQTGIVSLHQAISPKIHQHPQ
jgi:hypothetical protein